jgi:hypothetical protein
VLGPPSASGFGHQGGRDTAEGLDDLGFREGRLDLLCEAGVGVGDLQLGRDRQRDVDEDLAAQRLRTDLAQRVERGPARNRVHDYVPVHGGFAQPDHGQVEILPGCRGARAEDDVVASGGKAGPEGGGDPSGAEKTDAHECSL